ncbi:MAG: hypothetical protein A2167_07855 [Planctomycetes bacterium RBG_13_46_10]|nr:MAG: hypothetical protein A2167_07855 [Planctomycetes bacterium RBG_13_46_10]
MKSLIFGALTICAIATYVSFSAPAPAVVQNPGDWTVNVTFEHPQQIVLKSGIFGTPKRFWYVIVTLINNTNQDVDFFPKCDLMTDTFQITPAGGNVPPAVFEMIKKRHQSRYPFLESLQTAGNRILQGEDNAKDIAIIWPYFDVRATGFQIFITGLSNETVAVEHPVQTDENSMPVQVYLRKTLALSYNLKGDTRLRSDVGLEYKGKRWVMR